MKFNLTGHASPVNGLKLISSDLLASGAYDYTVKLWNITNERLIKTLTGHTHYIYWSIDFFSNSQTLVSGSFDQTIKLWNYKTGECLITFETGLQIRTLTVLKSTSKSLFCAKNVKFLRILKIFF
jgi:WD40 repeat protein